VNAAATGPTRSNRAWCGIPVLVIGCALTACGGSGGGGDAGGGDAGGGGTPPPPSPTINLAATAVEVLTPDPTIAYPLSVSVSISADAPATDVAVSLFAIEKNDDPDAEIRQFPLGSETIPQVQVGSGIYDVEVNVPSTIELAGTYFIAAIVDPVDEVDEANEDDNIASVETALAVEITPNFFVKELTLDRSVLEIDTSTYAEQVPGTPGNVHNADAGGTVTVGADGLDVSETIELEGFATLRLMRSDLGTTHDVPLYLWNTAAGRYMNAYGVDPNGMVSSAPEWLPLGEFEPQLVTTVGDEADLDDVDRHSVHINFYFPGKLGSELESAMRHPNRQKDLNPTVPPPDLTAQAIDALRSFLLSLPSNGISGDETAAMEVMSFAICVEVRSTDVAMADRLPDDNELCSPLSIVLPPLETVPPVPDYPNGFTPRFGTPSGPLTSGDGFLTKGGGSIFGFNLNFDSSATADDRGYIEELRGFVPVSVLGSSEEFMSALIRAQVVPDYAGKSATEESGYTLELRFLGNLLNSVDVPAGSSPALTISYSKESPDPPAEWTTFVGPIPVIGGLSIGGSFGIAYEFTLSADPDPNIGYALGNSVSPFANAELTVFAGVGNPLFSAGVEGVLTLFDERLTLFSGTQIEVVDAGFQSGIAEFVVSQGQTLTNDFTSIQGALNLFAKYTVLAFKTCSWGFVKAKCLRSVTLKATKNIYKTGAVLHLRDVLLEDKDVQLDVVVVPGEAPAYFVP
jgi:hypothetical protein